MLSEDSLLFNQPATCSKCGRILTYKGLGQYECECGNIEYDDYGAVRAYIEAHPGSTIQMTSAATGVSKDIIRDMVKDGRFQFSNR